MSFLNGAYDPQWQIFTTSEVYLSDDLVIDCGRELVSATAIITGGVPLRRGSVLGEMSTPGVYCLASLANDDENSSEPKAILACTIDVSLGDLSAGIYLAGNFCGDALTLGVGMDPASTWAKLRSLSIFVREP